MTYRASREDAKPVSAITTSHSVPSSVSMAVIAWRCGAVIGQSLLKVWSLGIYRSETGSSVVPAPALIDITSWLAENFLLLFRISRSLVLSDWQCSQHRERTSSLQVCERERVIPRPVSPAHDQWSDKAGRLRRDNPYNNIRASWAAY